jgi:serine/threonine protein kinase
MRGRDSSAIDADLTGAFRSDRKIDPLLQDPTLPDALFAAGHRCTEPVIPRARLDDSASFARARGTIVDKYRLDEPLGVGGFAVVWRATHLLLRTAVALKLLRSDVIERRPALVAELVDEARCAARIHHENVVRILDVTHTDALAYIVMELVEGDTLASRIDRGAPMAWPDVARIGVGVASGLRAGLRDHFVHRDIKPANLILARDGGVKIVDFGLARAVAARELEAGRLVGTRGYMAPEVLRGVACDFRSDVFSLGVTLVEAAAGRRWRMATRSSRPQLPHVPMSGIRVLDAMIAADPSHRPSSYDALIAELSASI